MSVELDNDEAKMLAMLLVEDRSRVRGQIRKSLAPHGRLILDGLIDKLAGKVLGVGPMAPPDQPRMGQSFPMSEKG